MKIIVKICTLAVLFLFAVGALWAGDVTGGASTTITTLYTYVADTPAKASEVNQNFALIRDAVNDNDTRITSLESGAFILNQNETVTGRPYFYGGTSGSTPPFYVDSTYRVTSLNADYLDGYHSSSFATAAHSGQSKKAGYIYNGFSGSITSTSYVQIAAITISDTYVKDVSFNAHVVLEVSGTTPGYRYEFVIRRGGITGTIVGEGWWRSPSGSGYVASTISFTGFDNDISGAQTYYFYARKYDSGAPNAGIGMRGFTADWVRN